MKRTYNNCTHILAAVVLIAGITFHTGMSQASNLNANLLSDNPTHIDSWISASDPLVVWEAHNNPSEIHLYDFDPSVNHKVVIRKNQFQNMQPAVSGNFIVYTSLRNHTFGIYVCQYDRSTGACPEVAVVEGLALAFAPTIRVDISNNVQIVWSERATIPDPLRLRNCHYDPSLQVCDNFQTLVSDIHYLTRPIILDDNQTVLWHQVATGANQELERIMGAKINSPGVSYTIVSSTTRRYKNVRASNQKLVFESGDINFLSSAVEYCDLDLVNMTCSNNQTLATYTVGGGYYMRPDIQGNTVVYSNGDVFKMDLTTHQTQQLTPTDPVSEFNPILVGNKVVMQDMWESAFKYSEISMIDLSNPKNVGSNQAPTLTSPDSVDAPIGQVVSFNVNASDDTPASVVFTHLSPAELPLGATFTSSGLTGTFTWTPGFSDIGVHTFAFQVSDGVLTATKFVDVKASFGGSTYIPPTINDINGDNLKTVVCLGDSNTGTTTGWCEYMGELMSPMVNWKTINSGVGLATATRINFWFNAYATLSYALQNYAPDVAIFAYGTNDIGYINQEPEETLAAYQELKSMAEQQGVTTFIATTPQRYDSGLLSFLFQKLKTDNLNNLIQSAVATNEVIDFGSYLVYPDDFQPGYLHMNVGGQLKRAKAAYAALGSPVLPGAPRISITVPTNGLVTYGTNQNIIHLAGTYSAINSLSSVVWKNLTTNTTGTGMIISNMHSWYAFNIPLNSGENLIKITGQDSQGRTGVDMVVVRYTPSVFPQNDSATVAYNSSQNTINVLANDTGSGTLTVSAVTQPSHGTVTIASDSKSVKYTPTVGYFGPDSFTYTAKDSANSTNSANVTVTVSAPTVNAQPDSANVDLDSTQNSINVLANDSGQGTLSIISVTQPAHGTTTISGNTVLYTSNEDYYGSDSFNYTIKDQSNATSSAAVSVTVELKCYGMVPTIVGTQGPDNITLPNSGTNVVVSLGGSDTITGRGGRDIICSGSGGDTVTGGDGDDVLIGGSGNDNLNGNGGNDVIYGKGGDDILDGGDGNDTIYGGDGNDQLKGGRGTDTCDGGNGTDTTPQNTCETTINVP